MDDGIKIAMSPVQLAAALSDKTVTEAETMSNSLPGGLGLIMGSLVLAGATALCIAPEPTGLTKAGCVVVGAHSLDSIHAAANQLMWAETRVRQLTRQQQQLPNPLEQMTMRR